MQANTDFQELKQICYQACRDRDACKEGFGQMLRAETPTMLLRAWTDNWSDVWRDRYPDIINRRVAPFYELYRREFLSVGLTVNECVGAGKVLITDCDTPVRIFGTASAYVIGRAEVDAYENAIVYNHAADKAVVTLHDYACGYCDTGISTAYDRSRLEMNGGEATCHGACEVYVSGGTLRDHGHRRIKAWGEAVVISPTTRRITLSGNARIENTNEQKQGV